jgi:TonB family protein
MRRLLRLLALAFAVAGCAHTPPPAPSTPVAKARPAPKPTKPPIPKELTGDLVRPVLAQMDGVVSGCYALEYGGRQDSGGRLVVDWMIAPNGKVESASIAESSFGNPSFEGCVLEEAQDLKFPAAVQPTQISKPYLVRDRDAETPATGFGG